MRKCISLTLMLLFIFCALAIATAQKDQSTLTLPLLKGEQWWGGAAQYGDQMPMNTASTFSFNLYADASNNQSAPLLLSSKGRWVWCDEPFRFSFKSGTLTIHTALGNKLQYGTAGNHLATAYRYTSKHYFPTSGKWPDSLLVTSPQYNLWIELQYNPNQKDVLDYANKVLENGLPAGVLMIDDNWTNYYGEFDFDKAKFPDPKAAIDELHEKSFKVMLWICPFISADSKAFRALLAKKYLLLDNDGDTTKSWKTASKPLIIPWWNGYSACLDLTNPSAVKWLEAKLHALGERYGIDGYKLDAGDPYFYGSKNLVSYQKVTPNEQTERWATIGLQFPLNEYRAMWKMGGQPLVQRLADKSHTWAALQTLIPNTVVQQLLGYTFTCPDMIGGGSFSSFLPGSTIDQKLIVRSAQVHALMPMMQFSVAPWRILDQQHLQAVKQAVKLRQKMLPTIMKVMRQAAKTGEPALRPLCYNYPGQGYETIKDQFMMGKDMVVAPVLTASDERKVVLPPGDWYYQNKKFKGDQSYVINVQLNELPVFTRKAEQ